MLAPFGMLNDSMVDPRVMRATLQRVIHTWDWKNTWGWDDPLIAKAPNALDDLVPLVKVV